MECYFTAVIVFFKCNSCSRFRFCSSELVCNCCSSRILRINKCQISRIRYDLEDTQKGFVVDVIDDICRTITCSRRLKVSYLEIELPDRILRFILDNVCRRSSSDLLLYSKLISVSVFVSECNYRIVTVYLDSCSVVFSFTAGSDFNEGSACLAVEYGFLISNCLSNYIISGRKILDNILLTWCSQDVCISERSYYNVFLRTSVVLRNGERNSSFLRFTKLKIFNRLLDFKFA